MKEDDVLYKAIIAEPRPLLSRGVLTKYLKELPVVSAVEREGSNRVKVSLWPYLDLDALRRLNKKIVNIGKITDPSLC